MGQGSLQRGFIYIYAVPLMTLAMALAWDLAAFGASERALAAATAHSARIAFLVFFLTFTASVWFTWRQTPVTVWLMRRRRHFGLSFALIHALHLVILSTLFVVRGETPDVVTLVGGGLAYVLLGLMVVTSNGVAQRRLGRRWRLLHLTGCWYLWAIFTQSYVGRLLPGADAEPYAAFVLLTGLALAVPPLRTWARLRRRNRHRVDAGAGPAVAAGGG